METKEETKGFSEWAIVDIMGHQRYAGLVTEITIAGAGFLRVDVPKVNAVDYYGNPTGTIIPAFTKIFSPGSLHSMTPTTEEIATSIAAKSAKVPVSRADLPKQLAAPAANVVEAETDPGEMDDEDDFDDMECEECGEVDCVCDDDEHDDEDEQADDEMMRAAAMIEDDHIIRPITDSGTTEFDGDLNDPRR